MDQPPVQGFACSSMVSLCLTLLSAKEDRDGFQAGKTFLYPLSSFAQLGSSDV